MNSNLMFVEGEDYYKNEIPEEFIEKQYFQKNKKHKYTLKVCGIISYSENNYLFFPKGYNVNTSEENNFEFARTLFQVLNKYKKSVQISDVEYDWLGSEIDQFDSIKLVEWLIDDFKNNGIYREDIENNALNKNGRIDWARTIKNQSPLIKNNEFVYVDVITKNRQVNTNNVITLIHHKVIYECIKQFGWLFSIDRQIDYKDVPFEIGQQNIILEKKLSESFTNRQINLLKNLIAFINKAKNENIEFKVVTPYFYSIWEEMLKIVFGHNYTIQYNFPKPYWEMPNQLKKETVQIPDILIEDEGDLVIIDAKYYSTYKGEVNKFPGWESVVKQLYYNLSVNDRYEYIQNIFIMPESLYYNQKFKYIGKTSVLNKETEFGFVYAFSVDLYTISNAYISNIYLKDLINEIIFNTKELINNECLDNKV